MVYSDEFLSGSGRPCTVAVKELATQVIIIAVGELVDMCMKLLQGPFYHCILALESEARV